MIAVTMEGCAGWLHPAEARLLSRGAVIVPAWGFEELCSRRSLRILADRLAAAGIPTLRFDFHGTADSLGGPGDPDQLDRWIADAGRAVGWMRDHAGVGDVAVIGLRLGALVAAQASDHPDVAKLALLAPPASGKSYIRESSALSRIIAPQPAPPEGLAVAGFRMSAETVAAVKLLDWPAAVPGNVLIAAVGEGPKGLADRLGAAGGDVSGIPFTGYERMICDPTASEAPLAFIDQVVAWAADGAGEGRRAPPALPAPAPRVGNAFTEEAVTFGPNGQLAGILCRPARPNGRAVIITNAGGQPHVGWARCTVDQARALAGAGTASLRMDFAGLGDSRAIEEAPTPNYYDEATRTEISAAVDLMIAQGFDRLTVAGHCSGAHHAFHAGVADRRIDALVLTNLQCFVWGPRYRLPLGAWMAALPADIDLKKREADEDLGDVERWQAWLKVRTIALAKRGAKPMVRALQRLAAHLGGNEAAESDNAVEVGFRALSARGVRVHLVYSEGDPGLEELALYMGPDGLEATALPGVTKHIIAGADHVLSQDHARAEMLALLGGFMEEHRAAAA